MGKDILRKARRLAVSLDHFHDLPSKGSTGGGGRRNHGDSLTVPLDTLIVVPGSALIIINLVNYWYGDHIKLLTGRVCDLQFIVFQERPMERDAKDYATPSMQSL